MGWDASSRANLNRLRASGVVAVRYEVDGCDVQLEVLNGCIGKGSYSYYPYHATDTKIARNAHELYTELPLGAAALSGKLSANNAIRTDFTLVGMNAVPPTSLFVREDLDGPGCDRATHIVDRIYLGGFGMVSGETKQLESAVSFFNLGAGGSMEADAKRVAREGDPQACSKALSNGKESALCSAPLRVGLMPIRKDGSAVCKPGQIWYANRCLTKPEIQKAKLSAKRKFLLERIDGLMAHVRVSRHKLKELAELESQMTDADGREQVEREKADFQQLMSESVKRLDELRVAIATADSEEELGYFQAQLQETQERFNRGRARLSLVMEFAYEADRRM
jgi:hypothetical protein